MHGVELLLSALLNMLRFIADSEVRSVAVCALAGTLLWSGWSKVRHPLLAAAALMHFRLVKTGTRIHGQMLGLFELALAALLIAGPAPFAALAIATALFSTFTVLIGTQLRAGDTRPCYCFGSDGPVGALSLARAAGLALAAGVLSVTAPTWAPLPALSSIGWYGAGAAALLGSAALVAAIPTVLHLTSVNRSS